MPDDIRPLFAQREVNLHAFPAAAAARAFAFGGLPHMTSEYEGVCDAGCIEDEHYDLDNKGDVLLWPLNFGKF